MRWRYRMKYHRNAKPKHQFINLSRNKNSKFLLAFAGLLMTTTLVLAGGKSGTGTFVLCTNWGDDTLSLVNIDEGRELSIIKVGRKPYDIKVDAKGRFAYASSSGGDFISVVDIQAMLEAYRIPVGQGPREIDLSGDGKRAVVANAGDDSISVVDLESRRELYKVGVGAIPYGVGFAKNDHFAVVSNWGESTISIVDLDQRKEVKRIKSGALPYTVIVSQPLNLALVTNFGAHQATSIDLATLQETKPLQLGRSPWGGSATSDGKTAFVANFYSNELSVIKLETVVSKRADGAELAGVGAAGTAATEIARISLNRQGDANAGANLTGLGGGGPDGKAKNVVARDDGQLAVSSDLANNQLMIIDIPGRKVLKTIQVGKAPYGIAFLRR
jgi:YVTN family beta-propeller protein